jgi:hypothetical protein
VLAAPPAQKVSGWKEKCVFLVGPINLKVLPMSPNAC